MVGAAAEDPCTCLQSAVPSEEARNERGPSQEWSLVKRGQLKAVTTVGATDTAGAVLPGGFWEEGTWGSRWSRGRAGQTLSAPRQIQSAFTTPGRPQHHHLPEGDLDVLHSLSRAVSPSQILGPRTQESSLEG